MHIWERTLKCLEIFSIKSSEFNFPVNQKPGFLNCPIRNLANQSSMNCRQSVPVSLHFLSVLRTYMFTVSLSVCVLSTCTNGTRISLISRHLTRPYYSNNWKSLIYRYPVACNNARDLTLACLFKSVPKGNGAFRIEPVNVASVASKNNK